MNKAQNEFRFVYFGTPKFAAIVLDELEQKGLLPVTIVTAPDKPKGRKLALSPSQVKVWATEHKIPVLTPEKIRDNDAFLQALRSYNADFFIVAAYGKIIPKEILEMTPHGILNVHPSLLPKFRGSSPIESAILSDEKYTGVTIMLLDEEMDHGPILAQRERIIKDWPPRGSELTEDLAHFGGSLLADIIPEYLSGLKAFPQDHSRATFTKKIVKEDGLLDLEADVLLNYKKIKAYDQWPSTYFFAKHNGKQIRVRVTDASYKDGTLTLLRVVPEGKKEMSYEDFLRGNS